MSLLAKYQALVDAGKIKNDLFQRQMLPYLQAIIDAFAKGRAWWRRLLPRKKGIKGLYFYGGVGVGKTFLMDLFYDDFPSNRKIRQHFHVFMKDIHEKLGRHEGECNPLMEVANELAHDIDLLCLDECVVNDIGDAMIIERLLTALFNKGVILVTTSNFRPDDLYLEGLHRKRFLGAIALIKKRCTVVPILSKEDHRQALLDRAGTYLTPINAKTKETLEAFFASFSDKHQILDNHFELGGRPIEAIARSKMVIWFNFDRICASPRSQLDYINLADSYSVFMVSNVPVIAEDDLSQVTYLILLIDVLYDKGKALILSAQTIAQNLYPIGKKVFEFQRTLSRLEEMGSKAYLAKALSKSK